MKKLISAILAVTMLSVPLVTSACFADEVKNTDTQYIQNEKRSKPFQIQNTDWKKVGTILASVAAGATTLTIATVAILNKLPKPIQEKLFFFNNKKEQEESQNKAENENVLTHENAIENNNTTDIKPVVQEKKSYTTPTASDLSSTKKTPDVDPIASTAKPITQPTKDATAADGTNNPAASEVVTNNVNLTNKDDDDIDNSDEINSLKNPEKNSPGLITNLWGNIKTSIIPILTSTAATTLLWFITYGKEKVARSAPASGLPNNVPVTSFYRVPRFACLSTRAQFNQKYPDIESLPLVPLNVRINAEIEKFEAFPAVTKDRMTFLIKFAGENVFRYLVTTHDVYKQFFRGTFRLGESQRLEGLKDHQLQSELLRMGYSPSDCPNSLEGLQDMIKNIEMEKTKKTALTHMFRSYSSRFWSQNLRELTFTALFNAIYENKLIL